MLMIHSFLTVLRKTSTSMTSLRNRLEESLKSIEFWLKMNSLKMNPSKPSLHFWVHGKPSRKIRPFYFEMSGHKFSQSKNIKILGVMI